MAQIIELDFYWTWNIALCSVSLVQLLHVLKAVENAGAAVSDLIPMLSRCVQNQSVPLELRLAAVRAFRRIPCHHDVSVIEFKIYCIYNTWHECVCWYIYIDVIPIMAWLMFLHYVLSYVIRGQLLLRHFKASRRMWRSESQHISSSWPVQTRRFSQLSRQRWAMRSLVKVLSYQIVFIITNSIVLHYFNTVRVSLKFKYFWYG